MLHFNVIACGRDTRDGFIRPRVAMDVRTRKTGPYPPLELNEFCDHAGPRRPGTDTLDTFATPVVVG